MNISEIWRPVVGYEGLYEVSNCGRVRSHWFGKVRILKPTNVNGYKVLHLCKDGVTNTVYVHELVVQVFPEICGEWFPGAEIDHKDGDRGNNKPGNLSYKDHKANMNNPITKERMSNSLLNCKETSTAVIQMTKEGTYIAEYPSGHEAERKTGIDNSAISKCCKGRLKTAGGFKWQYK